MFLYRLRRLKEKSHVQIPLSDGRMLLGTVDETNSLRYGQVFIQLRDLDGEREIVDNRKVLVTKNPAHFPGDIRILDAVDCPALHHLSECIVFPAEGQRPHPNEISGSDLDGDEVSYFSLFDSFCISSIKYWVCWNEDLVNSATKQHDPANFDSAGKTKHPGEITLQVIADFLFKYLSSDSLGVLSNRHLACCALHKPDHEYSVCLAEIISQAVDFPKTGVLPKNPTHFKINKYPDFMENKHKESFESDSSIGTMYRQVKEVWNIHSTWQEKLEEKPVPVDRNLIIKGYEEYISEAEEDYQYYSLRINTILSIYNLQTEYELITGCHSCAEEEKKNNDSVETALLEFRCLVREMRKRFAQDSLK
jgi:RNA-dependent RNA polymerase